MRLGIIDMGTNTFHLLIADVSAEQKFKTIYKSKSAVKLGENGLVKGFIDKEPMQRALRTMKRFKDCSVKYQVDKVYAFATSAVRDAVNKDQFCDKILKQTGINVNVISGDTEAELICMGVRNAMQLGPQAALIMDIGGGSVEFIIANDEQIFWKRSFDIGVSRLMQAMPHSDPITPDEQKQMETLLDVTLKPLWDAAKVLKVKTLIGSSGSFDTYTEMVAWHFHETDLLKDKTTFNLSLIQYKEIHNLLLQSTTAERSNIKGLIAMRVEMIVAASILTNYVIQKLGIEYMKTSTYALKEGALLAMSKAHENH